eukprot:TRINITY_DN7191_c0_g1_i2.p2 TRINITY_DN7191_c0_g1~~TRINITY_DN7191_c0_g1_i2.p2  ORF type:complete len:202 (+),score=58.57 TRINITY_DN7191_c0_g1_i2:101-706(+)
MDQEKLKATTSLNGRLVEDIQVLDEALLRVERLQALVQQQTETKEYLETVNEGRKDVETLLGNSEQARKQQETWLADLAAENGELHAMVDELTTGLQVIMSRHRSQVSTLRETSSGAVEEARNQIDREKHRTEALEQEVVKLTDQVEDLKGVMAVAAERYDHDDLDIIVEVTQLEHENALLREALKISRVELDDVEPPQKA